jgi:hypothetical protein
LLLFGWEISGVWIFAGNQPASDHVTLGVTTGTGVDPMLKVLEFVLKNLKIGKYDQVQLH